MHKYGEKHYLDRQGWLRAAVLGANDGIVSTSSLLLGMAAAGSSPQVLLAAGIAGWVAGAMSMAAGEYVSVSSQSDIEQADLQRERLELKHYPEQELAELAGIYEQQGLDPELALEVARQLTEHDALASHARDELGLSDIHAARPLQAAFSSGLAFTAGALLPLLTVLLSPPQLTLILVIVVTLFGLLATGRLSAQAGGAKPLKAMLRVSAWGMLAMAITFVAGFLFGGIT